MRPVVVVVLLVLTAAACSGGDDAATATSVVASTTTSALPSTTSAPSSSTTAPTTAPTTTSTVAPTSSTTAPTTSTTVAPPTSTLEDVIAAASAAYEVSDQVRRHPDDPDALAAMATVMTAERIDYLMSNFVLFYRANGLVERPNPDLPAGIEFRPESFTVDLDEGTASIEFCYVSSNLLVEPGGNDDGSDRVHDDSFGTVLGRRDMVLADGRWLDDGGEDLVVAEGETTCDAA